MTVQYLSSGSALFGGTVSSGETLVVLNGGGIVPDFASTTGTPTPATVASGGLVVVSSGGLAFDLDVDSGGEVFVSSGGVLSGVNFEGGGLAIISSGGSLAAGAQGSGTIELFGGAILPDASS